MVVSRKMSISLIHEKHSRCTRAVTSRHIVYGITHLYHRSVKSQSKLVVYTYHNEASASVYKTPRFSDVQYASWIWLWWPEISRNNRCKLLSLEEFPKQMIDRSLEIPCADSFRYTLCLQVVHEFHKAGLRLLRCHGLPLDCSDLFHCLFLLIIRKCVNVIENIRLWRDIVRGPHKGKHVILRLAEAVSVIGRILTLKHYTARLYSTTGELERRGK